MPSRDALMLPDVLTEGDNLEMPPLPDTAFLLSQDNDDSANRRRRAASHDINLAEDFGNSQYLQSSILEKNPYGDEDLALDDDLDLGLDLGLDITPTGKADISVEMGRDAPAPRPFGDDIGDSDLNIFAKDGHSLIGERQHSVQVSIADNDDGFRIVDEDGDINMGGAEDFAIGDGPDAPLSTSAGLTRGRISESPLSDIDPNLERDLEAEHQGYLDSTLFEPFDETEQSIKRNPTHRARKVKVLQADNETVIPSAVIKAQQQDHSKILRPQSFIPRDPSLYALMEMQRNGSFVSNIISGARSAAWAPELRGMLSLDAISKSRDLKRKRDSGIADMDEEDSGAHKSPRLALNIGEEADFGDAVADMGFENVLAIDKSIIELADDGFQPQIEDEGFDVTLSRPQSREGSDLGTPQPNFDETTAPLVHPADSGPVSIGTKHAVHLLRDCFGAEAEHSPNKRKNASVLFQELLPETTTSKADATKMFFEVLVLATKDAVKVEQKEGMLGGPIRVRGKRGLWGSWAEREAGGGIAEDEAQVGPNVAVES
jgi:cohesin complex subunit SCC1